MSRWRYREENIMRKKKIAVVTATRAEYGLLTPLIRRIAGDQELALDLIVTGGHLAEKQGYTINRIREDGFPISHEIPILAEGDSEYEVSLAMSNAIRGFADCFRSDRPDMLIILGDRTEMLGVAAAAMNERIPIAHIHGGEVTEGAVDDCVRHAITKMSYLHFTATELYRKRVIQLGEDPMRVFHVGALGIENIFHTELLNEDHIKSDIGIPPDMPYAVVTFHPVTLECSTAAEQALELCAAMERNEDYFYLITKANTDAGGNAVNEVWEEYTSGHSHVRLVSSLGMKRYLSAVKYAAFVLGNSSSGIIEVPAFGVPVINIGDRQKGRIMSETIINCPVEKNEITKAINGTAAMNRIPSHVYGDGKTSMEIIRIIKKFLFDGMIDLKKGFYDIRN